VFFQQKRRDDTYIGKMRLFWAYNSAISGKKRLCV